MKKALTAINWLMRGMLVALTLVAAATLYLVITSPGTVAEYVLEAQEKLALMQSTELPPVDTGPVTGRLPQASQAPIAGGKTIAARPSVQQPGYMGQRVLHNDSIGNSHARGVTSEHSSAAREVYVAPTAERKVLRVGE